MAWNVIFFVKLFKTGAKTCGSEYSLVSNVYKKLTCFPYISVFKAQILKVLQIIYRLVQSDSYATKRSVSRSNHVFKWNLKADEMLLSVHGSKFYFVLNTCFYQCVHTVCRDIYYNNTQLFGSQKTVDSIVDDISCMLKVPRRSLHVVSMSVSVEHRGIVCQNTDTSHLKKITSIAFVVISSRLTYKIYLVCCT